MATQYHSLPEESGQPTEPSAKDMSMLRVVITMLRFTLSHTGLLVCTIGMTVGYSLTVTYLPKAVGETIDSISNLAKDGDKDAGLVQLEQKIVRLLATLVGLLTINVGYRFSTFLLKEVVSRDMRNTIFSSFLSFDLAFFEKHTSAELVNRITNDVQQVRDIVSTNLMFNLRHSLQIVSYIYIMVNMNPRLAMIIGAVVPINFVFLKWYSIKAEDLRKKKQALEDEMSSKLGERFQGIELVKTYSTQEMEKAKFGGILQRVFNNQWYNCMLMSLQLAWGEYLPRLGVLAVVWYGGKLVITEDSVLTAGELTTFIMYCDSLVSSSTMLSFSYMKFLFDTVRVRKVLQLLEYRPELNENDGSITDIDGSLSFENLSFSYPSASHPAINDLSLEIEKGEYVAFVGRSGSGKSTITKIIEKLYKVETGGLKYGDWIQQGLSAKSIRSQIGIVTQQSTLLAGTIRDNIAYGNYKPTDEQILEAADKAGCLEFINDAKRFPLGLESPISERGANLSGGQRQRIAIARALMRKPKILIFDEATSALDSKSELVVQESIENLVKASDRPTIIVIAHRLSTVIGADRIVMMQDGRAVEQGSHADLRKIRGLYYDLVKNQIDDQAN